jgi:hypothetical protein
VRRVKRILFAMTTGVVAAVAAAVLSIGVADADPAPPWQADDHFPDMMHGQCAGGHGGAFGFAWCDGARYPDGSYWHQVGGAGIDALKPHCVIDTGDIQAPPAPPSGCAGHA